MSRKKLILSNSNAIQNNINLDNAFTLFEKRCKLKGLTDVTIHTYYLRYKRFSNWLFEQEITCANEITEDIFVDFMLHLKEQDLSDSTVANYVRHLRTIIYFYQEKGIIPQSFKIQNVKINEIKINEKVKETYTDEEIQKLLFLKVKPNKDNFVEYKNYCIVNTFCDTGMRVSSLANLKISDLDFENNLITLRHTKSKKVQILVMSRSLATLLSEYLSYRQGEDDDILFLSQ